MTSIGQHEPRGLSGHTTRVRLVPRKVRLCKLTSSDALVMNSSGQRPAAAVSSSSITIDGHTLATAAATRESSETERNFD
eukprot:41478-Prymnesium_polylepis.1